MSKRIWMARAGRRPKPAAARESRVRASLRILAVDSARTQTLEHRILLTATFCLLAFGAVMVYSSSSASTLLQGQGSGTGYLVKFVVYGALGLVVMRLPAPDGIARIQSLVGPMLAVSFVLVLAVHIPHVGVSVNGARRWIGSGPLQFQPSELLKLALVLYGAALLARRPQRVHDLRELSKPLLAVAGAACLLVATHPAAQPRDHRRLGACGGGSLCDRTPLCARAAHLVRRSMGARLGQWLSGGARTDRDRLGRAVRRRPGRVGAEDLLPTRGPHGLHPGRHRRGAWATGGVRAAVPLWPD